MSKKKQAKKQDKKQAKRIPKPLLVSTDILFKGYAVEELTLTMIALQNSKTEWTGIIDCVVDVDQLPIVVAAIEYYTGGYPQITQMGRSTTFNVQSVGHRYSAKGVIGEAAQKLSDAVANKDLNKISAIVDESLLKGNLREAVTVLLEAILHAKGKANKMDWLWWHEWLISRSYGDSFDTLTANMESKPKP